MNSSSASVDQFKAQIKDMGYKEPNTKDCEAFLKKHKGNLGNAVSDYLDSGKAESQPQQKATAQSKDQLLKIFQQYQSKCEFDESLKAICGDGLIKFAKDLGIAADSIDFNYIFCKFNPKVYSIITDQEFIEGMTSMRCANIQELAKCIPVFKQEVKQVSNYEKMYVIHFDQIKRLGRKERLDIEDLYIFHKILLQNPENISKPPNPAYPPNPIRTKLIDEYMNFLEFILSEKSNPNSTSPLAKEELYIIKDTWEMIWQFFKKVHEKNSDVSWYSETSHFPTLIDEFMEWREQKKN